MISPWHGATRWHWNTDIYKLGCPSVALSHAFLCVDDGPPEVWLLIMRPVTAMRQLLLFRTGCHGLAVDLGRAVALLEQNGLALCVGLALEMRCTLYSSVQLCRC